MPLWFSQSRGLGKSDDLQSFGLASYHNKPSGSQKPSHYFSSVPEYINGCILQFRYTQQVSEKIKSAMGRHSLDPGSKGYHDRRSQVAKTPCLQFKGPRFHPWSGNQILHAHLKIPCATTETQLSQINTYFLERKEKAKRKEKAQWSHQNCVHFLN